MTATTPDGIGISEVWRVVCETRDAVKELGAGVTTLSLNVVRLQEQFTAHVDAQARRTQRRDAKCAEHLGLIQGQGQEIGALRTQVAASSGEHTEEKRAKGAWPVVAGLVVAVLALGVSVVAIIVQANGKG